MDDMWRTIEASRASNALGSAAERPGPGPEAEAEAGADAGVQPRLGSFQTGASLAQAEDERVRGGREEGAREREEGGAKLGEDARAPLGAVPVPGPSPALVPDPDARPAPTLSPAPIAGPVGTPLAPTLSKSRAAAEALGVTESTVTSWLWTLRKIGEAPRPALGPP